MAESTAAIRVQQQLSEEFKVKVGVRQGDALSAVLFNLVLEAAIRKINRTGSIVNKTTQILGYADDITIIARDLASLNQTAIDLEPQVNKGGLQVNKDKTKYMYCCRNPPIQLPNININGGQIESVKTFNFLGTKIANNGNVQDEISARILKGNKCYYAYLKLIRSSILNRRSKITIYKTLIRPVVTYGCETWTLTNNDENQLRIFERKILRRIYGPVHENGMWRIRMNHEIEALIKGEDIVRCIKSQRIRWLGHVYRMEGERIVKRILEWKPQNTRPKGRPKKRWIDDVEEDLKTLRIGNWRRIAVDRTRWRNIVEQAKTHQGL